MSVESGIKPQRLEFVRESTEGVVPTDPAWNLYSDQVQSVSMTPSTAISPRRSVGTVDVNQFLPGAEDHEFEVTYDLQQWLSATGDPAYDGMVRDSDTNELTASHSIFIRDRLGGSGEAGNGHYQYTIFKGAKIGSVELSGEPESGEPVTATLSYVAEKSRTYEVSWPDASTLTITSTDDADTMSITLEDEGASTSETIALTGTTSVTTTSTFSSLDAFELDAEPEGDVTIEDDSGNTLVTIYGRASYDDREGDVGIPPLGAGSHGTEIGSSFEIFAGDLIERPSGAGSFIDTDDVFLSSAGFTIDNSLESTTEVESIRKVITEGVRTINISASLFGAAASYHSIDQHLRAHGATIKWTLSGGNIEFSNAVLTDPGDVTKETETAVMTIDNTFEASGLTIN